MGQELGESVSDEAVDHRRSGICDGIVLSLITGSVDEEGLPVKRR